MLRPLILPPLITILLGWAGCPASATVLDVGLGQPFATLAAAVAAASGGDTIDVYAGTYTNQVATIDKPLTIQGFGGTPVFTETTDVSNGKGFLIINASTTINDIEFDNATDADGNGAGIRYQSGNLIVSNSRFVGDQDGILASPGTAGTGSVLVENSTFLDDGIANGPDAGFAHALYATRLASLTVQDSDFQGTQVGHDIKSRAATTVISGNTLDDGVTGTTSYAIDISNGGIASITDNTITQGPHTQNPTMIAYAAEGLVYTENSLLVDGNIFDNSLPSGSIAIDNHAASVNADVTCNVFNHLATPVVGPASLSDNEFNTRLPACVTVPEPPTMFVVLPGMLALFWISRRCGVNCRTRHRAGEHL